MLLSVLQMNATMDLDILKAECNASHDHTSSCRMKPRVLCLALEHLVWTVGNISIPSTCGAKS